MINSKRSICLAFVAALLFGSGLSTPSKQHRQRGTVRGSADRALTDDGDDITCRLSFFEFRYQNDVRLRNAHTCSPMVNGAFGDLEYEILIDDATVQAYSHHTQNGYDCIISVTKATIDERNARIILSPESEFTLLDPEQHKRRRKLAASIGSLRVLVIRITVKDKQCQYSASDLYRYVFSDSVSVKHQYQRCSFNKLIINPTEIGVMEVFVDLYSSSSSQEVINAASVQALSYLSSRGYGTYSSIRDFADLMIFVTPDLGPWLAYASVGGGTSVFNDRWGGYLATLMHETGHNYGLMHSHEDSQEYLDYTGYMGGAIQGYHDRHGFPSMCYNAYDLYVLGWYSDRVITTDINTPTLVRLAAFVDYPKTTAGLDYVIIKSMNVYMHYNRAKDMNVDTYEFKDCLTIYQAAPDGSYLFAHLSYSDNKIYEKSFAQGTWRAEICDKVDGDSYIPDYLLVSVGFGNSLCPSTTAAQHPPTPSPVVPVATPQLSGGTYYTGGIQQIIPIP